MFAIVGLDVKVSVKRKLPVPAPTVEKIGSVGARFNCLAYIIAIGQQCYIPLSNG
jgi:hypothetical protein